MLDRTRLHDFMRGFYGYGNWSAKLWFVGMEEGGGETLAEIEKRLAAWDRTQELADLHDFHAAFGATKVSRRSSADPTNMGETDRDCFGSGRLRRGP